MSAEPPRLLLVEPIPPEVAAAVRSWAPDVEAVGGPGRLRTEAGPVVLLAAGATEELEPVLRAGREVDDVTAIVVVAEPEEGARALSAGAKALGVHFGQGYYLGRPMPMPDVVAFLDRTPAPN